MAQSCLVNVKPMFSPYHILLKEREALESNILEGRLILSFIFIPGELQYYYIT